MAHLTKDQWACAAALNAARLWPRTPVSAPEATLIASRYDLLDELVLLGAGELIRRWRTANPADRAVRQAAAVAATSRTVDVIAAALKPIIANQRTANENAKVVELLDSWMVGGVRLGDCTKDRLIAEAGKLAHTATTARRHAALYQKLAGLLKAGETVRKSSNRKALLAILRGAVQ